MYKYFENSDKSDVYRIDTSQADVLRMFEANPNLSPSTVEVYNEYVKLTKTIPSLASNNINHQFFQNTETSLSSQSKQEYQNSLFSDTLATIANVSPAVPFVAHVRYMTNDNKIKYDNFNEYLKSVTASNIERSNTFYDEKVNGSTDEAAYEKATSKDIDLSNLKALNGRNEFLSWLLSEHPVELRKYLENVNSLNYSTFLTEDEVQ